MTPRQDDAWLDSRPETEPPIPWTAEQARALARTTPPVNPWAVVRLQGGVGATLVLAWFLLGSDPVQQVRSTLWGVAAVVLPHALMAWGLRRPAVLAAQALLRFFVWELVKVGLALVILVAAVRWEQGLSWPALLLALVLCLKLPLGWHVWALRRAAEPDRETN